MIHSINSWERRVSCIVHPDADGIVDSPQFGGIRTEKGRAGYYVSIAEKAKGENGEELPFVRHRTERFDVDAQGWSHQVIVNPSAVAIATKKS